MSRGVVKHFMSSRKLRRGPKLASRKAAMWQYLLDHARPHETLGYVACFSFQSRATFEKSLQARKDGWYRFTLEEINAKKHIVPRVKVKNPSKIPMWKRRLISFIHRL
jgi:hypothetical protein